MLLPGTHLPGWVPLSRRLPIPPRRLRGIGLTASRLRRARGQQLQQPRPGRGAAPPRSPPASLAALSPAQRLPPARPASCPSASGGGGGGGRARIAARGGGPVRRRGRRSLPRSRVPAAARHSGSDSGGGCTLPAERGRARGRWGRPRGAGGEGRRCRGHDNRVPQRGGDQSHQD